MLKRHSILICWIFLFLCVTCTYSNEVQIGDYKVTYAIPSQATPIKNDQKNMLGAWEIPDFGNIITIQAFNLSKGLYIDESGIAEGIEEAIGAKIRNFKDFKTDHLVFREGTASIPNINSSMIYLSYCWADGICIKIQGRYLKENENASVAQFRSIISSIEILSQNNVPLEKSNNLIKLNSHDISKLLGGISFFVLAIVAIFTFLKKRKKKNI